MARDYRSLVVTTAAAAHVMTVADAKIHMHVTHSAEDDLIQSMIYAAEEHITDLTGRQLINATYTMRLDGFPADYIRIPRVPLSSVTSVAYVDAVGDSQTLTVTTDYLVDTYTKPPRIYLPLDGQWPNTYGEGNDVTIVFVAGYGASYTYVPDRYIHAVKLDVAELYANRERFREGQRVELPTYDWLLGPPVQYTF